MFLNQESEELRCQNILEAAYEGLVESILQFMITARYENMSAKDKNEVSKIVNVAGKVIGKSQKHLCDISDHAVPRKARQIDI